jgi:hypothetical protein
MDFYEVKEVLNTSLILKNLTNGKITHCAMTHTMLCEDKQENQEVLAEYKAKRTETQARMMQGRLCLLLFVVFSLFGQLHIDSCAYDLGHSNCMHFYFLFFRYHKRSECV